MELESDVINSSLLELHSINSVTYTNVQDFYIVNCHLTDGLGIEQTVDYALMYGDPFGLAPTIEVAVRQWILDGNPILPYVPPPPVPVEYSIDKMTPWDRMSDPEADVIDALLSQSSARFRNMYNAAVLLWYKEGVANTLWDTFFGMLVDSFGVSRAAELMRSEDDPAKYPVV